MYQMKNKLVINAPHNSAVIVPTSGNRARNTLSQLAANHVSSTSAQLSIACGHQSVPVLATSAHYPLSRGATQKCLLRLDKHGP